MEVLIRTGQDPLGSIRGVLQRLVFNLIRDRTGDCGLVHNPHVPCKGKSCSTDGGPSEVVSDSGTSSWGVELLSTRFTNARVPPPVGSQNNGNSTLEPRIKSRSSTYSRPPSHLLDYGPRPCLVGT